MYARIPNLLFRNAKLLFLIVRPGDQPWDFFGRNDAKAETPVLWPPHAKSWLIGKDSDAGRDCGQKEKGSTEDEMAGWHHWLYGRESGSWWWTGRPGVLRFMGSQRVRHDWATELNWTELIHQINQPSQALKLECLHLHPGSDAYQLCDFGQVI